MSLEKELANAIDTYEADCIALIKNAEVEENTRDAMKFLMQSTKNTFESFKKAIVESKS